MFPRAGGVYWYRFIGRVFVRPRARRFSLLLLCFFVSRWFRSSRVSAAFAAASFYFLAFGVGFYRGCGGFALGVGSSFVWRFRVCVKLFGCVVQRLLSLKLHFRVVRKEWKLRIWRRLLTASKKRYAFTRRRKRPAFWRPSI